MKSGQPGVIDARRETGLLFSMRAVGEYYNPNALRFPASIYSNTLITLAACGFASEYGLRTVSIIVATSARKRTTKKRTTFRDCILQEKNIIRILYIKR